MNNLQVKGDWNINTGKLFCFITVLVGIHGAGSLQAAVNIISVEHRVWGDAGQSPAYHYDETGSVPLSGSISVDSPTAVGSHASSTTGYWSAEAHRSGAGGNSNGYAQNTYVFKPLSGRLSITLSGIIGEWWFENDAQMRLTDLSSRSLVSIYQSPSYFYPLSPFSPGSDDLIDYPINWSAVVDVNPEHEYELLIFVGAHRGESGPGAASLTLTLAPEPGSAMLVGMAVALGCVRRKRPKI